MKTIFTILLILIAILGMVVGACITIPIYSEIPFKDLIPIAGLALLIQTAFIIILNAGYEKPDNKLNFYSNEQNR